MKVTAVAAHAPEAVRAALAARGWEAQPAWFAAIGIQPFVVLIEGITEDEREALVHWGTKSGADVLTGGSGQAPRAESRRSPVTTARPPSWHVSPRNSAGSSRRARSRPAPG